MFNRVQYYESADIMPIGRYMLATCRDMRYFVKGNIRQRINKKRFKNALKRFNSTIVKNADTKQIHKDLLQLGKDEGNIYLHSALVSVIAYCDALLEAGADEAIILEKLKPIQSLLIERGISPDSLKNKKRLEKISRNFKVKSDNIQKRLKQPENDSNKVYESYLKSLVLIEKHSGIRINEHADSVNKYVLMIDELNRTNGNGH